MKDRDTHYDYIVSWVDDVLVVSNQPKDILASIQKVVHLKNVGTPNYFLGADMGETKHPEKVFAIGNNTYCQQILEKYIYSINFVPPKNASFSLENFKDSYIKFYVDEPNLSQYPVQSFDWEYLYPGVKEQIPKNVPKPKRKSLVLTNFVDANFGH